MIPIRDENPTRRFPWLTMLLIVVNGAVFAYELSLGPVALQEFWMRWSVVPSRLLADPFSPAELLTPFTAMFMHAGWPAISGEKIKFLPGKKAIFSQKNLTKPERNNRREVSIKSL